MGDNSAWGPDDIARSSFEEEAEGLRFEERGEKEEFSDSEGWYISIVDISVSSCFRRE